MKSEFEVVISPTNVLGEEMKDVLGGINNATACTKCKRTYCNCDEKEVDNHTKGFPGYAMVDHILVEID